MIQIQRPDPTKIIIFFQFILFIFELTVFINYVNKEVIPYYPFGHDQASFLATSYQCYTEVLQTGFSELFKIHSANSLLFVPQVVLFFLIFGANRLVALLINFSYFMLLQIFILQTVKSITGRYSISFLFLGLLLSANTPFFWAGGLVDVRIDFIAFCLYGIFTCCVIRSNLFVDKKWSFFAICFASLLVLTRLIAFSYIFAIVSSLLVYFLVKVHLLKSIDSNTFKVRIKNSLIAFFILLFLFSVVLYFQWKQIYNYYVIGHLIGNEKAIRAQEVGATNLYNHFIYYPDSLFKNHISSLSRTLMGSLLFIGIVSYIRFNLLPQTSFRSLSAGSSERRTFSANYLDTANKPRNDVRGSREICIFLVLSILFPLIILTIDQSKSPIVIGILLIPCLFLFLFLLLYFFDNFPSKLTSSTSIIILSMIVFSFGLNHFTQFFLKHGKVFYIKNALEISKMYDDIGNYFSKNNSKIIFSSDTVADYNQFLTLLANYYERHHILLNGETTTLGGSFFSISKEEAINNLKKSNVFIVNMDSYKDKSPFPFDHDLDKIRPILINIAQTEFLILNDYFFKGSKYRVYVKP